MVSTPQKREGARVLKAHRIPERRIVALLGISRAGLRYKVRPKPQDHLAPQIRALSAEHPRWGQNRIWALLRRAHVVVNLKAVGRLWRKLGLQVTRRPRRKKIRTGDVVPQMAERPNHVWTYDFVFAWTLGGEQFIMVKALGGLLIVSGMIIGELAKLDFRRAVRKEVLPVG